MLYKAKLIPIYDVNLSEKIRLFDQVINGDVASAFKVIVRLHSLSRVSDIEHLGEVLRLKTKLNVKE